MTSALRAGDGAAQRPTGSGQPKNLAAFSAVDFGTSAWQPNKSGLYSPDLLFQKKIASDMVFRVSAARDTPDTIKSDVVLKLRAAHLEGVARQALRVVANSRSVADSRLHEYLRSVNRTQREHHFKRSNTMGFASVEDLHASSSLPAKVSRVTNARVRTVRFCRSR